MIPMPYPDDPQSSLHWNIEAPYLAISDDQIESSVLSSDQFEHCRFVQVTNLSRNFCDRSRTLFMLCHLGL